jgi:hypothetical protein
MQIKSGRQPFGAAPPPRPRRAPFAEKNYGARDFRAPTFFFRNRLLRGLKAGVGGSDGRGYSFQCLSGCMLCVAVSRCQAG